MKNANDILINAAGLIKTRGKERDKDDGERSMARCVESFNTMTGHSLTETEGWQFMMFLKMARMQGGNFKFDDYEDNVSYSALMAESAVKENEALRLAEIALHPFNVEGTTLDQKPHFPMLDLESTKPISNEKPDSVMYDDVDNNDDVAPDTYADDTGNNDDVDICDV